MAKGVRLVATKSQPGRGRFLDHFARSSVKGRRKAHRLRAPVEPTRSKGCLCMSRSGGTATRSQWGQTLRNPRRGDPCSRRALPQATRVTRNSFPLRTCTRPAGARHDRPTAARALFLPSEHGELMSPHEQLDVFGDLAAPASDKQPQHSREGEIGRRKAASAGAPRAPTGNAGTWNLGFETPQG